MSLTALQDYSVERILEHKVCDETHRTLYRVKWVGFSRATWEPKDNLGTEGEAILARYQHDLKAKRTGRRKTEEAPNAD